MLKLLKYAKKYALCAFMCPLLMVGEVVLELLIPLVTADIVDEALPAGDMQMVLHLGGKMLLYALGSLFCGALAARLASVAGMGFGSTVRGEMLENIQKFSFSNIDRFSTASLITRLTTDVTTVQNTFLMLIRMLFRAPLMFVVALVICVMKSREVSSVFFVSLPLIMIFLAIGAPIALRRFKKMMKMFDGFNASIQENFMNIRVVKAFVRSEYEKKKFKKSNDDLYNASISAEKIMIWGQPLMMLIMYGTILGVLYLSAKAISAETLQIGDFAAIFTYIMQILMSFLMIIMLVAQFFMSEASARRILEVIKEKPDITDSDSSVTEVKDGSVEFKNVSFKYGEAPEYALKNINFKIESGEMVGIIGATGSSKSTLVQLIPRLYDVSEGEILVGGVNVKDYKMHSLRDNVSMVLQKNVLFSGTIAENLRWGNKNATDEELVKACEIADARSFVESFPDSYNTDLGQGGVNVSGGQKQRLCIARAILKKPKILILDDSTSAVDTFTDAKIRAGFRNEIPDITKIIIAQRISSVEDCDKIIIIDNGEINDIGTHDELLERNEIYRDIYDSQQKGNDDFDLEGGDR